jgi:superfamily II DNA helicase RecQ
VSFLSYYSDFKLVLCSYCSQGVIGFRTHLISKHFSEYSKQEKKELVDKVLSSISILEVASLEQSLELIYKFISKFPLYPFPELPIKSNLFYCSLPNCQAIKANKANIIRHIKEEHSSTLNEEKDLSSYYSLINGQSLVSTRLFFPIVEREKLREKVIGEDTNEEEEESSIIRAKEVFRATYSKKKIDFEKKFNSCKIDPIDNLSPFQTKTRYTEFINQFPLKDLVDLYRPLDKEEEPLEILVVNLKEILYLSLEKSIYLNKIHLNLLNSFEGGKTRNKGFKVLLNGDSRVTYFNFFSDYFIFLFRSLNYKKRVFKTSRPFLALVESLKRLAALKLNENINNLEDNNSNLKLVKKSLSKKLNRARTKQFLSNKEELEDEEDEEEEGIQEEDESIYSGRSFNPSTESSLRGSISSKSKDNWEFGDRPTSKSSNSSQTSIYSTSKVIGKIEEINSSKDKISLEIKDKLIELLILIFVNKTDLYIFDSSINCFFACKSIRENNLSIRDTLDLSQYYSRFIYCSQLIVIEYSFREILKNQAISLVMVIQDFMSNHFVNSSQTALGEILLNRSYCFRVNKELSSFSRVVISSRFKETLSYKKVTISVDNLRDMFKELVSTSYTLLVEKLLLNISSREYKEVTLDEFSKVEDRDNTTPYKCFKDFHPNSSKFDSFISNKVLDTPSLRNRFFILKNNILILNSSKVKEYYKDILEFKKLCLILIYLLSGLPLRGTELVSLRYKNSVKDPREMFLDIGSHLFILNISKYKGGHISERQASSIRYLPEPVSNIFLLYIVLVDPFIEFLNISSSVSSSKVLSPYYFYFNKKPLESRDLSLKLTSFSTISIGQKIGIQTYRQLIVGIIREFMGENLNRETLTLEEDESSLDTSNIKASQMNHSLRTDELHYARSSKTFSNVRGDLQLKYLQFCLRFFDFFKLSTLNPSNNIFINNLVIKTKVERENTLSKANSLALRYCRSIEASVSLVKKHSRQVSSISSSLSQERVVKKLRTIDLHSISSQTSSSNLLASLLKEFLGDSLAKYKIIEQELLVKSILLKIPYILGVLPTSSGKSLTYLLTASLSISKITIVIVPLVGLKRDILRRAREFNIPCSILEDNLEYSTLTLVSIETIIKASFISSLNSLIEEERVDRIILDEFHLLDTSSSYRGIMYRFKELLVKRVQFVFLTGTLPLSIEERLLSQLALKDLAIIRARCSRNNICYQAKAYTSLRREDRIFEIKEYIEEFQTNEFKTSKDKVIIFCPSFYTIDYIASALNCSRYSSESTDLEKEEVLDRFFNSEEDFYSILVTSSGLEEGLDYPCIRLVVYIDYCHSFIGFIQGSSRGGRDSLASTSIFFYSKGEELSRKEESREQGLFRDYLGELVCRRRVIDLYIDEEFIEQCSIEQVSCDLCIQREKVQERQVSRIIELTKEVEEARAEVINSFLQVYRRCIYCTYLKGVEHSSHPSSDCREFPELEELAQAIKEQFSRGEFVLRQDSCCFKCLVPTVLCKKLKESVGKGCFLSGYMYRVIGIFFIKKEVHPRYKESSYYNDLFSGRSLYCIETFVKSFTRKVYVKELGTEAILGFKYLAVDS